MRRNSLVCIVAVLLSAVCFAVGNCDGAGNCYVSIIATGTGTGADWANACTDFTGACNVTSSAIRGTTIWVGGSPGNWVGTPYKAKHFSAPDNGTQTVTIIAASGDNHGTDTGWRRQSATGIVPFTGPINITTDYWIFNGQFRGRTPNSTESQGGGTYHDQQYGYHMQVANSTGTANGAIQISGNFITLRYIYVQGSNGNFGAAQTGTDSGIYYAPGVHDQYLGYSWVGFTGGDSINASSGSNFTFEYNMFSKNHAGLPSLKSQGFNIGDITNLIIRYNHFHDITGVAILTDGHADATAFTPDWYFYGNDIFWSTGVHTGSTYGLTAGIINLTGETLNGGVIHVYNNTIAGFNVAACVSTMPCNSYALNLNGTTGGTCAAHTRNCIGATAPVGTVYNNLWWNPYVAADIFSNTAASPQWTPTADYGEGICASTGCTNSGSFTVVGAHDVTATTGNPFKSFNAVMGSPNWYNFNFLLTADTAAGLWIPNWSSKPSGESVDPNMVRRGANGTIDRGSFQIDPRALLTVGVRTTLVGLHIGATFQETPVCTWSSAPTSDNCPDGVAPFIKKWDTFDSTVATISSTGLVTAVSNHNAFMRLSYGGLVNQNIVIVVTDGNGTKPVATLPNGIVRTGSPVAFSGYDTTAFDAAFPTTYNLPTGGKVWKPLTSADFVNALNGSAPGDVIVLQTGTIYSTNGTFSVPARANPSGKWTYIISSNMGSLPPQGTRIKPSDAINMPKIVQTGYGGFLLSFNAGADHWWLAGIEMYSNANTGSCPTCNPPENYQQGSLVSTGALNWPPSGMPDSITLDRVYLHGDDTHDVNHILVASASHFAILDSYVGPAREYQSQANAASTTFNPGPMKIINNFFWGDGQDNIWGGSGGASNMWMLRDVYVARNTFWNDPGERVVGVTVPPKNPHQVGNNFELKTCERCLVDGNILQQSWISGQSGGQALYNLGTWQSGPDQVVSDVTFSNNILTGALQGVFTSEFAGPGVGCDMATSPCFYPGEQRRLSYFNNLYVMGPQGPPGGRAALGSSSISVGIPRGMADVLWQHNTLVGPYKTDHAYCDSGFYFTPQTNPQTGAPIDTPPSQNIWLLDNVSCRATSGNGAGTPGTNSLNILMGDPSSVPVSTRFYGNVMQLFSNLGDTQGTWPPNNQTTFTNFTYVDPTTGNYQLQSPVQQGSDGVQTGINYSTLMAHQAPPLGNCSISGIVSGGVGAGVAVSLTGDATTTFYANPDGTFSFPRLAAGNYTVTPFNPGYTFSPASITVTNQTCVTTGVNFNSTATATYTISGQITGRYRAVLLSR